jgi:hypothetical protein
MTESVESIALSRKRSWFAKHPVLLLFVLLLGVPASLNYSGFCMSRGWWLGDEERIRIVIEEINRQYKLPIETKTEGTKYYIQEKYESVEDFLNKNPNCCKVTSSGYFDLPAPNFLDRVMGNRFPKVINISFLAHYIDESHKPVIVSLKFPTMQTNCGKDPLD